MVAEMGPTTFSVLHERRVSALFSGIVHTSFVREWLRARPECVLYRGTGRVPGILGTYQVSVLSILLAYR